MQALNGRLILSPSDLNDYVECPHLTTLAVEVARGRRPKPFLLNEHGKLLQRKGDEHEAAYLETLRAEGREVVNVIGDDRWDFEASARTTLEAMRAGADVIYQATYVRGDWRGRADFVMRVERPSDLGAWSYEALDAKLARAEKPVYVLQLCFYTEAIEAIQGVTPAAMRVLLGTGEPVALRYTDFAAYYRRVKAAFTAALERGGPTEPYRVEHCNLCEFRRVCEERWQREDHLLLVANIRRDHVTKLRAAGLPTLVALGSAEASRRIPELAPRTFENLRDQAALQLHRRTTGALTWHPLESEPGCGFEKLPRPSDGDVIFDIEGDPFWEPARGLHFLFGLLMREDGAWRYRPIWAHDRAGERRAFETLVGVLRERLGRHPGMHVYHYGAYEPTALRQLMGVYATREEAMDDLLRHEVFVDLLSVVRQGLRAGVSSYSLKDVEALPDFQRAADVRSGTGAVLAYEAWMRDRAPQRLDEIIAYNDEDCRATLALRDWLVANRPPAAAWALSPDERPVDEERQARDAAREALRQAMLAGAAPGSPRWLVAELLEYHRREARPAWWWFYARCAMSADELIEDGDSIGGLRPIGGPRVDGRSTCQEFSFPEQEHKLAKGDSAIDPATGKSGGTIEKLDDATGMLTLRRGPSLAGVAPPAALIPGGPIATREPRGALARLAESVLRGDRRYPALEDIVARAQPRLTGGFRGPIHTTDPDEQCARAAALDGSYLFIQGPPGTGKTWTGARIVVHLMERGQRVGVASTSHKAIHNLLDEVQTTARKTGVAFRGLKKCTKGDSETEYTSGAIRSAGDVRDFVAARRDVTLLAGTAWLFAHRDLDGAIDTLVIDEAGQVSLADALAMGTSARNVILLGDPLQLAQVSQGTHPEGTGASVLEHLLGMHPTVPAQMGIFLDRTRRMHPDVGRFISEIVYESRLDGIPEVARQTTTFGTGLRFLPVEHAGNVASAPEEAARVAREIRAMLGGAWTDRDGTTAPLRQTDFMVVAPYNAQVRRLRERLSAAGLADVPVGTVDKFQGRQAPVVFYSMATSSAEDVPRSLEFLFSRNRLNVAVSRAQCLAFIVASPRLLESRARTIEQMRLINALCRFVEMAQV
jgi:predicted RecB family nuclease